MTEPEVRADRQLEHDLFELVADVQTGRTPATEFSERLEWILAIRLGRDAAEERYARARLLASDALESAFSSRPGRLEQPAVASSEHVREVAPPPVAPRDEAGAAE